MSKKLSEMSLEELWQLFPIFLVKPNEEWEEWYKEQERVICLALQGFSFRVDHIGSTAVKNIWAKNIVDILVEIDTDDLMPIARKLEETGYLIMSVSPERISLNRGYTEHGFAQKVYHLHLRKKGDNAELYFRDYLIDHPTVAKEYESLKLRLWKEYEHDRDGYTEAKSDFVRKYTLLARKSYIERDYWQK